MNRIQLSLAAVVAICIGQAVQAKPFDGAADNGVDELGWYYAITGGQFPTGTTPNGDNASGGTFRFVTDDAPLWGRPAAQTGVWQKDDFFPQNAGIAVTLRNGASIVYDNNGLEADAATPADPNYYNYNSGTLVTGGFGAVTAYSMSNNYDWVYAGYLKIETATTVTSLTGYFAQSNTVDPLTNGFDPSNPYIAYRMNIWSNVDGDLLPTDTDSFDGDVFTSDLASGAFTYSDTGIDRVGSSSSQNIYRLTYTLDDAITLQPGEYWFAHDAIVVPEPTSLSLLALGGLGLLKRRNRA